MNKSRQLMKDRLVDLQDKKETTRKEALRRCEQIVRLVNPVLTEIVEMDIATAAGAMDKLVMLQAEMFSMESKIKELEEALYS